MGQLIRQPFLLVYGVLVKLQKFLVRSCPRSVPYYALHELVVATLNAGICGISIERAGVVSLMEGLEDFSDLSNITQTDGTAFELPVLFDHEPTGGYSHVLGVCQMVFLTP